MKCEMARQFHSEITFPDCVTLTVYVQGVSLQLTPASWHPPTRTATPIQVPRSRLNPSPPRFARGPQDVRAAYESVRSGPHVLYQCYTTLAVRYALRSRARATPRPRAPVSPSTSVSSDCTATLTCTLTRTCLLTLTRTRTLPSRPAV